MSYHLKELSRKTIMTWELFSYSVLSHEDARKITESIIGIFFLLSEWENKDGEKTKTTRRKMKGSDCYKSMGKCPRCQKCSVPLCPLDLDVEERVYLEGEPTCQLGFEKLAAIADDGFEEQYRKFIKVSLDKGARFRPLRETTTRRKKVQETRSQK